jgi:hypothetical protein
MQKHLKLELEKLREHQLYTKFSKYDFWLDHISFLGHVVTKEGFKVDLIKVETIAKWKQLENATKIKSFLGLVRYY